jgi:hypothetical protein
MQPEKRVWIRNGTLPHPEIYEPSVIEDREQRSGDIENETCLAA